MRCSTVTGHWQRRYAGCRRPGTRCSSCRRPTTRRWPPPTWGPPCNATGGQAARQNEERNKERNEPTRAPIETTTTRNEPRTAQNKPRTAQKKPTSARNEPRRAERANGGKPDLGGDGCVCWS